MDRDTLLLLYNTFGFDSKSHDVQLLRNWSSFVTQNLSSSLLAAGRKFDCLNAIEILVKRIKNSFLEKKKSILFSFPIFGVQVNKNSSMKLISNSLLTF